MVRSLLDSLAPELTSRRTRDVIGWWEQRRYTYNMLVGLTGVAACAVLLACGFAADALTGAVSDIGSPFIELAGIIMYGLMANVCYTGGWVVTLALRAAGRDRQGTFSPRAFRAGLIFSLGLTSLPAVGGLVILLHAVVVRSWR
jgi:hypothetical protein